MKTGFLGAFFMLILISVSNMPLQAQANLPDDGVTSEAHKANMGKIVFSKTQILFQEENASTFVNSFTWGDPIYGRFYWAEGLNDAYLKAGIDSADGFKLLVEMKANGQPFYSYLVSRKGSNTTFPLCFYPADDDEYLWQERLIIYYNLEELKVGDNTFQITLYPYNAATEESGTALCTGSFTLNVDEASITRAKQFTFTGLKTTWSGDNAWAEWTLYLDGKSGSVRTRWSGDKGEWTYEFGKYVGNIKTTWSNNYTEWTVSTADGDISIKQTWSNDWKDWTIRSADETITVKTTWSGDDGWKEWDAKGPGGTMKVKTTWSGDDAWKEWTIYDNMGSTNVHMKMAAVFICMYAGVLY